MHMSGYAIRSVCRCGWWHTPSNGGDLASSHDLPCCPDCGAPAHERELVSARVWVKYKGRSGWLKQHCLELPPREIAQRDAEEAPEAEDECQPGCNVFTGGERRHDKNCVHYPESLTKIYDDRDAELKRLRHMVRQMRGMADQGTLAPTAADRWCERIEEVAINGPQDEYEEWAWPEADERAGGDHA